MSDSREREHPIISREVERSTGKERESEGERKRRTKERKKERDVRKRDTDLVNIIGARGVHFQRKIQQRGLVLQYFIYTHRKKNTHKH